MSPFASDFAHFLMVDHPFSNSASPTTDSPMPTPHLSAASATSTPRSIPWDLQDRKRPYGTVPPRSHAADDLDFPRKKVCRDAQDRLDDSSRLLACPYAKHDPTRYSHKNVEEKNYQNCSTGFWKDISRLKQHLYRTHDRTHLCCQVCWQKFTDQGAYRKHMQSKGCTFRPCPPEKMTSEQAASMKERCPNEEPRESWNRIYAILFPDAELPTSPYAEPVTGQDMRRLCELFLSELPTRIHGSLQEPQRHDTQTQGRTRARADSEAAISAIVRSLIREFATTQDLSHVLDAICNPDDVPLQHHLAVPGDHSRRRSFSTSSTPSALPNTGLKSTHSQHRRNAASIAGEEVSSYRLGGSMQMGQQRQPVKKSRFPQPTLGPTGIDELDSQLSPLFATGENHSNTNASVSMNGMMSPLTQVCSATSSTSTLSSIPPHFYSPNPMANTLDMSDAGSSMTDMLGEPELESITQLSLPGPAFDTSWAGINLDAHVYNHDNIATTMNSNVNTTANVDTATTNAPAYADQFRFQGNFPALMSPAFASPNWSFASMG